MSFKLYLTFSGVFETSSMFWDCTYMAEQVFWNTNTDNHPINIITYDELKLVKERIYAKQIQYKTFSASKLLIFEAIENK